MTLCFTTSRPGRVTLATARKETVGQGSTRRDAVRNRARLIEAMGEILRADADAATMPAVAERAGLAVATAYRYFSTIEELRTAYLQNVIVQLRNYSHDCTKTGVALFEDVVGEWARLLRTYGPAMIQIRSRHGLLARLRAGDELITAARDTWERPIRGVMRHLGIPDHHFEHALFLHNVIFDPREIQDLVQAGLTERRALRDLAQAYYGALRGWAQAETPA
jgi:AcrR family transcriptional regulator